MKKVVFICNLFNADARYFLNPVLGSSQIKELKLFRNVSPQLNNDLWKAKGIGFYKNGKLALINRAFKVISQKNIDLYIGIYEIPHGLLALFAALLKRKPSVVSVIGNPKYSIRNKGLRGFVTNWIYKKASVITVTGSQSKNYLIEHKNINQKKVFILPNSVPIEDFTLRGDIPEKKYHLVTIGRLSPEKGLIKLIEIINDLRKEIPNIKLGIAGKGPQMDLLKKKIKTLSLEDNIDLLGYVESAGEFLKSGKVFITTSITEGLPRTAIQSMLMGLPVIASNVGDMQDLVIDNKTGYLIDDPTSGELFSKAILNVIREQSKYKELCQNAIIHVRNNYSQKMATKVWDEIINYLGIKD